jgi:ubiquinone/menaquinone biosynthesis C-methylase UbiE
VPTRREVRQTFEAIAEEFDTTRTRPWPEVTEFVARVPPSARVLDLGCGNGRHAVLLAEAGHDVVGLDFAPALLRLARERARKAGVAGRVAFVQGDLLALPFPNALFPAAILVAAVHHLPTEGERRRALREMRRCLRPDGRALVTAWARDQSRFAKPEASAKPAEGPGDVYVPWTRRNGRVVQRFYHLFADDELRTLCREAGFRVESFFRRGDNYVAVVTPRGRP